MGAAGEGEERQMSLARLTDRDGEYGALSVMLSHVRHARLSFEARRPAVSPFADGFTRRLRQHEDRLQADLDALVAEMARAAS